jgi:hypothetical protein
VLGQVKGRQWYGLMAWCVIRPAFGSYCASSFTGTDTRARERQRHGQEGRDMRGMARRGKADQGTSRPKEKGARLREVAATTHATTMSTYHVL